RLRFLLAFILAVLTAALVDRIRGIALAAGMLFAVALLAYISIRFGWTPAVIPSAIALAAALEKRLIVFAVIAEIWLVTIGWNPVLPASTLYPRTPLIDAGAKPRRRRLVGLGPVLFPNTNAIFGIEDVRFHDPMVPARYVHAIGLTDRDYYIKWDDVHAELNTRWVLTADGQLRENPQAKPRFYSDDAGVSITPAAPTGYTLVIDAPKPAHISSSVGWARGWTPSREGVFVNFDVPAGHQVVRVRYMPLHIYAAFAIALATVAALAAYIIRAARV